MTTTTKTTKTARASKNVKPAAAEATENLAALDPSKIDTVPEASTEEPNKAKGGKKSKKAGKAKATKVVAPATEVSENDNGSEEEREEQEEAKPAKKAKKAPKLVESAVVDAADLPEAPEGWVSLDVLRNAESPVNVTPRRLALCIEKFNQTDRKGMFLALRGDEKHWKGTSAAKNNTRIAKGMMAVNAAPQTVIDRMAASSKPKKESGPKRIDVIAEMLKRREGATIEEIAGALLAKFPELSGRWKNAPASVEQYESFARTAIRHLNHGTNFSVAKEFEGRIHRDEKTKRYKLAKAS